jgi:chromate transporter
LKTKEIRYLIFLREVLWLAISCFGGPQIHLARFLEVFVKKRAYLTEEELIELQSLCQLLPGPTSTQTLTAIGYRLGGPTLSYFTLLVWTFPACFLMGIAAISISFIDANLLISITKFIKPMGVAFIFYSAYLIGVKVINTKTSVFLMLVSALAAFIFKSPYITPIFILLGGLTSSFKYRQQQKLPKKRFKILWGNLLLWGGVLIITAIVGKITNSLPIRLFENFYRNGSLAFGGGHILKPLLFNEFVAFKKYLTADEFLSGIAISEVIPGPTFSIASFVASLSLRNQGIDGQILGSFIGSIGIFLPGIFLIFFVIKFWDQLKQFRGVRASLEGINASSTGLTIAAAFSLFIPMSSEYLSVIITITTFILLLLDKIPSYYIILGGLILGFIFK